MTHTQQPQGHDENVARMVEAGYVVSPNNIWSLPGVIMYAGSQGIMEPPRRAMQEINVSADGVRVIRSTFQDGRFTGLVTDQSFADAQIYLNWVAVNGAPSLPGLPAFSNSWD